ncbi:HAD-IA family hydrolase [Flavobacteriaceae bacterium]|nr:HAD-IA family hydrolase [Flavobacteriaceae bacterium]
MDNLSAVIEKIGAETDRINIKKGVSLSNRLMYRQVFDLMNIDIDDLSLENIIADINKIFLAHPPKQIDPDLKKILDELRKGGITMNISSNTAYIEGTILLRALEFYGLNSYFDFFIFSDEIESSKPSEVFFKKVSQECEQRNVNKSEILHIGDSMQCDVYGAINFGVRNALFCPKTNDLTKILCQELNLEVT